MHGITFSNELISRDRGANCSHSCLLYSMVVHRLSQEEVYDIIGSAAECEKEFVRDFLSTQLIGIDATLMCEYVEFVSDWLLVVLGYKKLYNTLNPFDWMDLTSLGGNTDFFEKQVSEYYKQGAEEEPNIFCVDADF